MYRNLKQTLIVILLLSTSCFVYADKNENFYYVGMGFGNNSYELIELDSINTSDGPLSWEIYTGYQLGQYFSVELGYRELGNNEFSLIPSNKLYLSVISSIPIRKKWALQAEAGAMQALSSFGSPGEKSPFWGIGAKYQLDSKISLQGIYRKYEDLDINYKLPRNISSNYWGIKLVYRLEK